MFTSRISIKKQKNKPKEREITNYQKANTKSWFFRKINKITLASVKEKRQKTINVRNSKETRTTDIEKIILKQEIFHTTLYQKL